MNPRVVRVAESLLDNRPGIVELDVLVVNQDPLKFDNSERGMRVVELYSDICEVRDNISACKDLGYDGLD